MRFRSFKGFIASCLVAGAAASPLLGAEPAAAAAGAPDLTVSLAAAPNPVQTGGMVTYTVGVGNSSLERCNSNYPEPTCTFYGRAVSGVAVSMSIPAGATYYGGSGDHNFVCPASGYGTITCTNGSLAMDDWATITLSVQAPSTNGTMTATATVDPSNTIIERSETNNTATVSTTVNAPPPPPSMPDLVISALGGTTQAARGGQATYTATITNNGPATANNVNLKFMVGSSDWSLVSSSSSAGLAPCLRMFDELKMPALCPSSGGITLSSGQSAQATIVVQIPATATVGTYYAYAIADPYNQVAESNESNNTSTLLGTYVN